MGSSKAALSHLSSTLPWSEALGGTEQKHAPIPSVTSFTYYLYLLLRFESHF